MMKKIFICVLSLVIALSFSGCDKNVQKNSSEPRPLAQRNEILQEIQANYKKIKDEYDSFDGDNEKKEKLKQELKDNVAAQAEVMNGINGEENFNDLTEKVKDALEAAQLYNDLGQTDKADELIEMANIINYGNKEGKKTW